MRQTKSKRGREKKSTQDIEVVDLLLENIVPQVESGEHSEIDIQIDINGVEFERQAAGVFSATYILNEEYGCKFWAHPCHITGDIEEFAEDEQASLEQIKDDFLSPKEIHEKFGGIYEEAEEIADDISGDMTGGSESEPSKRAAEKIETLPEVVDKTDFKDSGIEDVADYLETVIDRLKEMGHTVFNNQVNVSYLIYDGNIEMSRDEKVLFGKIGAYVLGHSGCRIGVWKGDVVAVDDVRMYANRHEFDPSEFIEQSWSQKEAEIMLGSE